MVKKKAAKKKAARRPSTKTAKKNPAVKMKKLTGSTGWIKGTAFKVVRKRGGGAEVLVRR